MAKKQRFAGIEEETPRLFIHFAHEIESAVPEDAEPCPACMA